MKLKELDIGTAAEPDHDFPYDVLEAASTPDTRPFTVALTESIIPGELSFVVASGNYRGEYSPMEFKKLGAAYGHVDLDAEDVPNRMHHPVRPSVPTASLHHEELRLLRAFAELHADHIPTLNDD